MAIRFKYILFIFYELIIIYIVYICTAYLIKDDNFYHKTSCHHKNNNNETIRVQLSQPFVDTNHNATAFKYVPGHRSDNEYICPFLGEKIKIAMIVTSALTHDRSRMAIRHTWGQYKINKPIAIGFLVGSTTNVTLQEEIEAEQRMYRDIIQGSFIDSYMNLTLKTISVLEWAYTSCPEAEYILKVDDDAFINVPHLLEMISDLDKNARYIYGRVSSKWKTHQEINSKYYVPQYEYNLTILPDFVVGVTYMFPSSVVYDLYMSAMNTTFMRLEDVFLTGISREQTDIKLVNVQDFVNKKENYTICDVRENVCCHLKQAFANQLILWEMHMNDKNISCT